MPQMRSQGLWTCSCPSHSRRCLRDIKYTGLPNGLLADIGLLEIGTHCSRWRLHSRLDNTPICAYNKPTS